MRNSFLLFTLFLFFNKCIAQTESQKQIIINFVSSYSLSAISSLAHVTCTLQTYSVSFNDENNFDINLNYTDPSNNHLSCTYQVILNGGFISSFAPKYCGSKSVKCFEACNIIKDIAIDLSKALKQNNQNNQENDKDLSDRIKQFLIDKLKKRIEDLSCQDYCYGILSISWLSNNYREKYNSALFVQAPHVPAPEQPPYRINSFNSIKSSRYHVLTNLWHQVHFFNNPDSTTQRNAYLSPNDIVVIQNIQYGFGYTEFTNSRGQVSKGWVAMQDLQIDEQSPVQNNSLQIGKYYVIPNLEHLTHFYNSPDLATQRNAYLSPNDIVYIQRIENGFGYTEFTNTKGQVSKGWITMVDLYSIK